jgi:hypothetical protein
MWSIQRKDKRQEKPTRNAAREGKNARRTKKKCRIIRKARVNEGKKKFQISGKGRKAGR